MKRDYLLMPIWAPMQSWGDLSLAGDDRPDVGFPTLSGICGLLAAALGISRDDGNRLQFLHHGLDTLVLEIAAGQVLHDFYSVQGLVRAEGLKVKAEDTFIGQKRYLADAVFVVALFIRDPNLPWSLAELGDALLSPKFQLYAGRKSFPFSLPPIFHQAGHVQVLSWKNPFAELRQLRHQILTAEKNKTTGSLLFQNRVLPLSTNASNQKYSPCYCGQTTAEEWQGTEIEEGRFLQAEGIPQKIWDRYQPSKGKIRRFEQRTVHRYLI